MTTKTIGNFGELLARDYLQKNGYKIITTNYRTKLGEVDIIAKEGETLCFIEVKTRSGTKFGSPEESINKNKLAKIGNCLQYYLQTREQKFNDYRIDVVAIELLNNQVSRIEIIKNASL